MSIPDPFDERPTYHVNIVTRLREFHPDVDDFPGDEAAERISTLEALTDQLAEAAYATNTAHDSWCPGDDPSPLVRRVWPDGCPFCAALRAYEADKEARS